MAKTAQITELKVTPRNTYGYQGAHGTAYTVTGKLPTGKRAVLRRLFCQDNDVARFGYGPRWEPCEYVVEITAAEFKRLAGLK
jgi:hypothetical protein